MQTKAIAGLLDLSHPGEGEVRRKDEFMCRGVPLQLMTSLSGARRLVGVELDRPIGLPQRDDRAVRRVACEAFTTNITPCSRHRDPIASKSIIQPENECTHVKHRTRTRLLMRPRISSGSSTQPRGRS
jgi:hypothetical protein